MLTSNKNKISIILVIIIMMNFLISPIKYLYASSKQPDYVLFQNDDVVISMEINTDSDKQFIEKFQKDITFRNTKINELLNLNRINKKNTKSFSSTATTYSSKTHRGYDVLRYDRLYRSGIIKEFEKQKGASFVKTYFLPTASVALISKGISYLGFKSLGGPIGVILGALFSYAQYTNSKWWDETMVMLIKKQIRYLERYICKNTGDYPKVLKFVYRVK